MPKNEKQVQRYERQLKHIKTREERKQLKELGRARRAQGANRDPSRQRVDDGDEGGGFERMKSHRGPTRSAAEVQETMRRAHAPKEEDCEIIGQVLSVHRTRLDVLIDDVMVSVAAPTDGAEAADIAVGDRVACEETLPGEVRLVGVLERRSEIARPDPGDPRQRLVIAANVDAALIVTSAKRPAFKPGLIDRFLIVLQRGGVLPIVCVNKADLLSDVDERAAIERVLASYRKLGLACHWTSAGTGAGLDAVRAAISDRTVVLVGQSGVGKSSLLNALDPGHERATGDVRDGDGKGRHTTSASMLHRLANGTSVIDTPGIRSLGLWQTTRAELALEFVEFDMHVPGCRFRDCQHDVEPECAVRAASESGLLDRARYEAYLRILGSLED